MADVVVCCDGTWNTPDDLDGGLPAPTNVVKIYNALAEIGADKTPIRRYYHPGVGTDGGWWDRALGGGVGAGLGQNVKSAYRWLAGAYRPKDRIWLFGFSRGAFTARSLSGMISRCGLIDTAGMTDAEIWAAVDATYDAYRARAKDVEATDARPVLGFSKGQKVTGKTPIHFIGVWDTVGALGIPDDMALLNLIDDPTAYEFHDTALSDNVGYARHAVALDERRQSFTPTLWVDTPPEQNVAQVWFPGVHSDVGGGYVQAGLANGALKWMMDEAADASSPVKAKDGAPEPATLGGLVFRKGAAAQVVPNARDVLHDSLTGVFKKLKTRPREAPCFAPEAARAGKLDGSIHASAYDRYDDPPLSQFAYWPTRALASGEEKTVDVFARDHWNASGIYLEKGAAYSFAATGEWLDKSIACGPDGARDGTFKPAEIVHVLSSAWGGAESLYKRLTGNAQADFWWTKREEGIDWFALVGMIASGEWFEKDGSLAKKPLTSEDHARLTHNETFRIGSKATITPKASGYLYCFANDAWQTYDNNRGSVKLTVRRA
ncbi:DUF2235 domain-containing protein [Methylopila turkensis]|uniref:T6SS Phospholipase effector Tle1-like catalytic domain-containing protein n=1 Tax=Methylopila turkensis TaxID=1437816 RepID=A0A9W6N5K6_9HYPH|nr:DUF2235 domain-containing protein [Methylopila turkensis]GLK78341.1 hypothetical protein GCM10008174_00820 [Methylopila turkensis]